MVYPYNNSNINDLYSTLVLNSRRYPTMPIGVQPPKLNTSNIGIVTPSDIGFKPQLPAVIDPEPDLTFTNGETVNGVNVPFYNPKYSTKKPSGVWGASVQNTAPNIASSNTNYVTGKDINKSGLFGSLSAGSIGNRLGNMSNKLGNFSLQGLTNYGKQLNQSYQAATGNPMWSSQGGIDKIGGLANAAGALMQGGRFVKGLGESFNNSDDLDSLIDDIQASAYANPLVTNYLNSDQRRTLRDIEKDRYSKASFGDGLEGAIKGTPKALLSALGGYLTGGIPGAAIQGIGSLVNSGVQGYNSANLDQQDKLNALYETLLSAEADYNSMRRPANLRGAGLSSRSYNSLY